MTNLLGEFMGTMMLMILGCGVVADCLLKKTKSEGSGWMVITAGWAFGVVMGVFVAVATGAPQADLNPAVTLAKLMIGGIYTVPQAIMTMLAELAGGIAGATVVWLAFLPHWEVTEDKAAKLGIFCTAPAIRNTTANLICEIIGTIVLVFVIFCIFAKPVGAIPAGVGPYLVGMLVWGIGLSLGGPTGYAINPARDLGPRIAHAILPIAGKGGSDWGYSWIPVVGPMVGGAIAFMIARAIGIV
ncbi:Glycerol uptake facilitator protein [bioreactor metagenome]|uniref:Glycerol uptake facilitator protein n=1 Tax=bioreactor metagenome TaxID=1076179 RepID=A0A644TRH5_9ZZZZ